MFGTNLVTGRYRYDVATQKWWWSDETYQVHGFKPGEVVPTTAMVLAHRHPEDRARLSDVLQEAAATGEPFADLHRITDAGGHERTLTVVGQGRRDPRTYQVCELTGSFLDLTDHIKTRAGETATASIRAAAQTRAPIEQAKGIIAFVLHIDPEDAFFRLRQASNGTNVPLRDVAQHIVELARTQDCSAADIRTALGTTSCTRP